MARETIRIIGINPGTRYLGIAILDGSGLLDWRIKTLVGKWSEKKIKKTIEIVSELIDRYAPNVLVIKKLHPSRSSKNLKILSSRIKALAKRYRIQVRSYSIKELENFFLSDEKTNKRSLAEKIVYEYPVLGHELEKEKNHKNHYYLKVFEAVALANMVNNTVVY
jgi:Holliday junction resolvasome RuvABC endonuclease subunit